MVFCNKVSTFERSKPDVMRLRIEEIMAEKGLRKAEVARKAGLVQTNLNKAISESGNPTIETLERIAKALGVEVYELFTDALPTEPEGLVLLGGQTYSLVKAPSTCQLPIFVNLAALRPAVKDFVSASVRSRETVSFGGLVKGCSLFSIIYEPFGDPPRFLLSITGGGVGNFTGVYLQDEYVETDKEGSYIAWKQDLIVNELCAAIESGGLSGKQFNNCEAVVAD